MFKLTNQQMLQRVDLTNNDLLTVDLSFDTNLQVLKLGGNPMLTNVILTGDNNIQQIHGGISPSSQPSTPTATTRNGWPTRWG